MRARSSEGTTYRCGMSFNIAAQHSQPRTGASLFTWESSSRYHLNFDLQAALNEK